jgi:hypothetical protein
MKQKQNKENSSSNESKKQPDEYLVVDAMARIVHKFKIDFEENKEIRGFIYKSFIPEDLIGKNRTHQESLDSLKLFRLAIMRLKKDGLVKSYKITTDKLAGMESFLSPFRNWCIESIIDEGMLVKNTKNQIKIIRLSDYDVSYDNEIQTLSIGTYQKVQFPAYKNEHYLVRTLFEYRKNEPIDWQIIYEAMNRTSSDTTDKEKIRAQQRSIKDAMRAVNKRVKEIAHTEDDLLEWNRKTVQRNY